MNRTISANISGIIFNIEEQAYERLKEYLEAIGRYFSNSQDRTEIMADIEGRIAELFSERITDRKEVISMADVDQVIVVMGQPEQYADVGADDEDEPQAANTDSTYSGGPRVKKRIFRDKENNVVGGVCSGISSYFDWDPIWMRIFFVLMFLSFGSGLFLYVILWIVIPEAKTTADKLAMKGEHINVENIGKSFNTEKGEPKSGLDEFADDIRSLDTDYHAGRVKNGFIKAGEFFKVFFKGFSKIIGVGFICAAIGMIIVMVTLFIGGDNFISITENGVAALSFGDVSDIIFANETISVVALIGIILVIGVPILSFLYTGIKLIFGIRSNIKPLGIALVSAWIAGFILCGIAFSQTASEFVGKSYVDEEIAIVQPTGDTLYLDILDDPYFSTRFKDHHQSSPELIRIEEDKIRLGWPILDVQINEKDTAFRVFVTRESRGPTQKEAITLSENIEYEVIQEGNTMKFSPYFSLQKDDNFRGQEVTVTVLVPVGSAVHFSPQMDRIIYDIDNVTNTHDDDMVGLTWTMENNGLTCIGCSLRESDRNRHYHRNRFQNRFQTQYQEDRQTAGAEILDTIPADEHVNDTVTE